MIYIKIYGTDNGSVLAMCDESLIDKVLEQGDFVIDIKSYSSFYKGDLVNKEKAKNMIENADAVYSANVIGKESVEVAIEEKIIDKASVQKIKSTPYAQAYRMV